MSNKGIDGVSEWSLRVLGSDGEQTVLAGSDSSGGCSSGDILRGRGAQASASDGAGRAGRSSIEPNTVFRNGNIIYDRARGVIFRHSYVCTHEKFTKAMRLVCPGSVSDDRLHDLYSKLFYAMNDWFYRGEGSSLGITVAPLESADLIRATEYLLNCMKTGEAYSEDGFSNALFADCDMLEDEACHEISGILIRKIVGFVQRSISPISHSIECSNTATTTDELKASTEPSTDRRAKIIYDHPSHIDTTNLRYRLEKYDQNKAAHGKSVS